MFCKNCGNEIVSTAVICPKCGSPTGVSNENPATSKSLITWGWVSAFLFPIVGIILGIVNIVKAQIGHGIGQIAVSIFMWAFWYGFVSAIFK